ncbi:lysine histidine transporter-like 8 isoform X4 [Ricinus communis]|uniref:lysine histidine transporter-like 8 isoform X4 n=1 Tax=Ricinus communis TaxID=3988 RepID=UPI00201ABF4E|nr:lysine histidine transporter-like 8 isoform X4 [Ricinus communis]
MGEMVEEVPLHSHGVNYVPSPSPLSSLHVITIAAGGSMRETPTSTDNNHDNISHAEANPQDAWLPVTESRNGNTCTSIFHLLSSGIGFQALLLPVAFSTLGCQLKYCRSWGIICLSLAFGWQLYTIWLLLHLHEHVPGTRYSRYLQLSIVAFGPKIGKVLAIFPVMYLSGGTCVVLIITGTFGYYTLIWVSTVSKDRPTGTSHSPLQAGRFDMARLSDILIALGIIMLSFRGHNLILEIQGTLPSSSKHPSYKPMWRAVLISYILIAMCLFPLVIVGFWAYGNKLPKKIGSMSMFLQFYSQNASKSIKITLYSLVLANCLSSFQIYAVPVFDNLELRYTSIKNKRCSRRIRTALRLFFGGLAFFVAVAFPFLPSLAAIIGGMALPLTFVYPCFMWISIKKPDKDLQTEEVLEVGRLPRILYILDKFSFTPKVLKLNTLLCNLVNMSET